MHVQHKSTSNCSALFLQKINIISVRTNISTIPFNFSNIKVAVEVSLFLQGKIKIMVNN
jgi:hypothetical protein